LPDFVVASWFGLVAPAATPSNIVARLNAEIARLGNLPDVRERLAAQGANVTTTTPEAFTQIIHDDFDRWGKVVNASSIRRD